MQLSLSVQMAFSIKTADSAEFTRAKTTMNYKAGQWMPWRWNLLFSSSHVQHLVLDNVLDPLML